MAEYYGEEKRMKIPVVEPGKGPCVGKIEHGLKAMQPPGAVPEHQRRPVDSAWINQIRVPIGHTLVAHGLCISKGSVSEIWHVPVWKPTLLRNVQVISAGVSKRETQYSFNFGMSY